MPVFFAVVEVVVTLLIIGLISFTLPKIPFPAIDIPFPDIRLPRIPFPNVTLPELPEWLKTILYWLHKTWIVWVAVIFAVLASKKKGNETKES